MSEEEDWVRREMHRVAGFAAICRSKGYKACILMLGSESSTEYLGGRRPCASRGVVEPGIPFADGQVAEQAFVGEGGSRLAQRAETPV